MTPKHESAPQGRIRVLIAKPGLDGHDVGAKVVCRALMEAGMEVIYSGLRQSPEAIAETALQEAVDVVGLSVLSGAHLPLCQKVARELEVRKLLGEVLWLVGGNVPRRDHPALSELGVAAVFPTGTALPELVSFIREQVKP
jgi:methylmalonyl-CoA mutase C-terminal domain/subunit